MSYQRMSSNGNVIEQRDGKFYVNGAEVKKSSSGELYHDVRQRAFVWFLAGLILGTSFLFMHIYSGACGVTP